MRRLVPAVLVLAALAVAGDGRPEAAAQTVSSSTGVVGDVSCPSSAGTPVEAVPRRPRRVGLVIRNKESVAVRIGYDKGSTVLTTSNSQELAGGASLSSGSERPIHQITCQSTDTTARTINVTETLQ